MFSRNARGVILPFKGGNFTISRLSLTLKDEELCRFSFLIIDGPFAYCLSFTAWLGGWETGWDFGFAYTRKIAQKNQSVNTHPSKQYRDLGVIHRGYERISRVKHEISTLPRHWQRLHFLYSLVWHFLHFWKPGTFDKRNKERACMVEQPICHNCQIVLATMFRALTAKMNETHDAWNITFSFFPLFGILVIHLACVNGKHRRDKHSFAATNVDSLWTSILCSSLQSNWKLLADWSIFSMAFILSRGLCFDESAGIMVVFVDLEYFLRNSIHSTRNFWLLLLFHAPIFSTVS